VTERSPSVRIGDEELKLTKCHSYMMARTTSKGLGGRWVSSTRVLEIDGSENRGWVG
jgi:hypothetical protein